MVLDDHVHLDRGSKLAEHPQAVGSQFQLILVTALGASVDADRVAAQFLGRLDPLLVPLDRILAFGLIRITQVSFTVDQDHRCSDTGIIGPLAHLADVGLVLGLAEKRPVPVLDGRDAELLPGEGGEVHVVELATTDHAVQRVLGERNLVERLLLFLVVGCRQQAGNGQAGSGQ